MSIQAQTSSGDTTTPDEQLEENELYETTSHIGTMSPREQYSYHVMFDFASTLLSQSLLHPNEQYFYLNLSGSSRTKIENEEELEETIVNDLCHTRTERDVTKHVVDDVFGSPNPFESVGKASLGAIHDYLWSLGTQDAVIDGRGIVRQIPESIRDFLVPTNSNVSPPTEVYLIDDKKDASRNTDTRGGIECVDTKQEVKEQLERDIEDDDQAQKMCAEVGKRLYGILKTDTILFDNGLTHDDLVGTDVHGNLGEFLVHERPCQDYGIPTDEDGAGIMYRLYESGGMMRV